MLPRHTTMLQVTHDGYIPADDDARKQHAKMKFGQFVGARIARNRSVRQQRLYWKVLASVVKVAGEYDTPEALHNALKVATNRIEICRLLNGRLVKIPMSTAFDEMNQEAFQSYMDEAMRLISVELMGGMSPEDILAMAEESEGPQPRQSPETNAVDKILTAGSFG